MKTNGVKVTIGIIAYNIEDFIGKCLQSAIDQDYENIEIIVVDDCSTDSTSKICDDYAKTDSRINIIHNKKNVRMSASRNKIINNATGEYITFIDGDDWIHKNLVSYMLKEIIKSKSNMLINLVNFTTRDYTEIPETEPQIWNVEKATELLLYSRIPIGVWNKMYSRKFLLDNNLFFEELYTSEGYRYITNAVQLCDKVCVVKKKLYYYRLNNVNSATTKPDIEQSRNSIKIAKQIENDLIIKTKNTKKAIKHQIWVNEYWNIRQMLNLDIVKENKSEYYESIKYVRKHGFSIAMYESNKSKKIKYCIRTTFPKTMAKINNYIDKTRLNKDINNEIEKNKNKNQ